MNLGIQKALFLVVPLFNRMQFAAYRPWANIVFISGLRLI